MRRSTTIATWASGTALSLALSCSNDPERAAPADGGESTGGSAARNGSGGSRASSGGAVTGSGGTVSGSGGNRPSTGGVSGRNAATAAGGNEPADASNEPDAGGHGTGPDAAAGDGGAIVEPCAPDDGKCIFRHDTFGDEQLWTKTLRLQDLVQTLSPKAALSVGLKSKMARSRRPASRAPSVIRPSTIRSWPASASASMDIRTAP